MNCFNCEKGIRTPTVVTIEGKKRNVCTKCWQVSAWIVTQKSEEYKKRLDIYHCGKCHAYHEKNSSIGKAHIL
jgi:hypothetical protein